MAMKEKHVPQKLTEETIHEDAALVARVKGAKPGQAMSGEQFKKWLADFR